MKHTVMAAAIATLLATQGYAYQTGEVIIRGGMAWATPDSSTDPIETAPALAGTALNRLDDVAKVDSGHSLTLTGTYIFHPNFGIEWVAAMPFEHDIKGDGALSAVGDIGSTKHLPPSLLLQFYPLEKSTSLMPYVGIGWNYTLFFEEDTNDEFTSAVAGIINTPLARTTLELDDSDGVAFELGADWRISDQFAVNTSVWYLDIDTTARIDAVTTGGEVIKDAARFDVEIDPLVYSVGAAFKF